MSIPADWTVLAVVDSQGVQVKAVDQRGDVVCTVLNLTHDQGRLMCASLLTAFRMAGEAKYRPVPA